MKKINLQVKVTYTVNFDTEVSDEVFNALECMQDEFPLGMDDNDNNFSGNSKASEAFDWLGSKCKEDDANSWGFEIEDLTEL